MEKERLNDLEIVSVNYNTPDLIKELVDSLIETNQVFPLRIIDGSNDKNLKRLNDYLQSVEMQAPSIVEHFDYNIHHGPGMDYALESSKYKYVLLLDSDVIVKKGLIKRFESMINAFPKAVFYGRRLIVDERGFNIEVSKGPTEQYDYIHPSCMLVRPDQYRKIDSKFTKHGAPCFYMMKLLNEIGLFNDFCVTVPFLKRYYKTDGRGTVKRFGYGF